MVLSPFFHNRRPELINPFENGIDTSNFHAEAAIPPVQEVFKVRSFARQKSGLKSQHKNHQPTNPPKNIQKNIAVPPALALGHVPLANDIRVLLPELLDLC